jgi:hypothetical protein
MIQYSAFFRRHLISLCSVVCFAVPRIRVFILYVRGVNEWEYCQRLFNYYFNLDNPCYYVFPC